jgi:hypothetical protein
MLRNLWARLYRLLHPCRQDDERIHERMVQYVGVEVPAYKIEPRHVHGELVIWEATDRRRRQYFYDYGDHQNPN